MSEEADNVRWPRCELPLLVLTGPTAAGKSTLAMTLCRQHGGEVVSADSVQVYRGLDIGSAKPTPAEREEVPHHLVDIAEPTEQLDAQRWADLADLAIDEIRGRGKMPIVVGGTGLYLRALLNGFDPMPEVDESVREEVRRRLWESGPQVLHEELTKVDPVTAARLAPGDGQRIGRALEVYLSSGRPLSEWHALKDEGGPNRRYPAAQVFGVWPKKKVLHERIRARAAQMLEAGWVDEVRALEAAGVPVHEGPLTLLGYRDVVAYLDGYIGETELPERVAQGHRRYAKRQLTWFRGYASRHNNLAHVGWDAVKAAASTLALSAPRP